MFAGEFPLRSADDAITIVDSASAQLPQSDHPKLSDGGLDMIVKCLEADLSRQGRYYPGGGACARCELGSLPILVPWVDKRSMYSGLLSGAYIAVPSTEASDDPQQGATYKRRDARPNFSTIISTSTYAELTLASPII